MRQLGVEEWTRVEVGNELDCIGEIAQRVLLRHGVLWPANTHFHAPQFERAAGGTLVTGIGGDEVFSPSGWSRLRAVASGGAAPEARDLLRLGAALAPHALRRRVIAMRSELELEWLRPSARHEVLASLAAEAAAEPLRWGQRLGWVRSASAGEADECASRRLSPTSRSAGRSHPCGRLKPAAERPTMQSRRL